jgi:Tfp pilus assembly protein PilF
VVSLALAETSFRQNRLEEAANQAQAVLAQDPKSADAARIRARVLRKQGRAEEAVQAYEEILRGAPEDRESYLDLEDLYQEREKWAPLKELIARFLGKWPNEPEQTLLLAFSNQQLGDRAKALELFRKGLSSPCKQAWPYINYGILLYESSDFEGASGQFRQALALDPNDDIATKNLGLALIKLGKAADAEAQLRLLEQRKSPLAQELDRALRAKK